MEAQAKMVKVFLDHGADVNVTCAGWTALMVAVKKGRLKLVKILCSNWKSLLTNEHEVRPKHATQKLHVVIIVQFRTVTGARDFFPR